MNDFASRDEVGGLIRSAIAMGIQLAPELHERKISRSEFKAIEDSMRFAPGMAEKFVRDRIAEFAPLPTPPEEK